MSRYSSRVLRWWLVGCGLFPSVAHANEVVTYQYDAQGRLTQAAYSGSGENAGLALNYQVDLTGNRLLYLVTSSKNRGQQVVVVPLNGFTVIPINP